MDAKELRERLERWLAQNSGYEERSYLGMSQIFQCPANLYDQVVDGREEFQGRAARMCYEGYLHERDMIARLVDCGLYEEAGELVAPWDERFRGHPDGQVDGDVLEVKSVTAAKFEEVRKSNRALQHHYEQVQIYLLYGRWERGVIVYKCRETGEIRPIVVWPHPPTQARLEEKAKAVLAAVDAGVRPKCECGRH